MFTMIRLFVSVETRVRNTNETFTYRRHQNRRGPSGGAIVATMAIGSLDRTRGPGEVVMAPPV